MAKEDVRENNENTDASIDKEALVVLDGEEKVTGKEYCHNDLVVEIVKKM